MALESKIRAAMSEIVLEIIFWFRSRIQNSNKEFAASPRVRSGSKSNRGYKLSFVLCFWFYEVHREPFRLAPWPSH